MLSGSIDPHYAIAGFLVGALVGVTGVGGGSLMTPILIVLFGVSPATAVGTDFSRQLLRRLGVLCTASTERLTGESCDGLPLAAYQ
jgi:hypothetical protein